MLPAGNFYSSRKLPLRIKHVMFFGAALNRTRETFVDDVRRK